MGAPKIWADRPMGYFIINIFRGGCQVDLHFKSKMQVFLHLDSSLLAYFSWYDIPFSIVDLQNRGCED